MSSTPSSSSSSVLPPQLDEILKTSADKPDFDLSRFVAQIDVLLAHYDAQLRKKNPIRERLGVLPSASEASNFADQVSTNVKLIANEIKEYSGNTHETSVAVLNAIGNVHWAAVGFLVVGATLQIADTIKNNKEECLRIFKSIINLSKVIIQLQDLPGLKMELGTKLKESINLIVEGAIICCSQKKRTGFKRVLKASRDRQELQQLSKDIDEMRHDLHLQINVFTLKANMVVSPPPVPTLNNDAVGIKERIEEVIQQLDWENDSTTTAVVVYGIGGSGKTTLADAVYASLKDKLQGWKYSKVTLIQNLEKDPKVEELQSLILQDLTATKQPVRDFRSGQQSLKEIIEKESIFLYIDNVLHLEPLKKLLPKAVTSARKLRILLTARETNVKGAIEACGIEPCKLYDMEPLSVDAALQILCKNIDRKREKDSILQERPHAKKIAEKCSCCPLFLEVLGAYIHQRKNIVEAYERVLGSLQSGDDFSGNKNYSFDESKVLFSYERLNPSAKEAFLDICSFFSGWRWEWEEVAWIVGEEEMECLQEGALIKREGSRIKIHDLILSAGRNKSKHSRLKSVEDFSLTLKNELVSQVKGVGMEDIKSPFVISAEELDTMSRSLRVFYMRHMTSVKGKCRGHFDELRFLDVKSGVSNLPNNIFNLKNLRYLSLYDFADISLSPSMDLPNLKVLKISTCRSGRTHGIAEIGRLRSLKLLDLTRCNTDGISQCNLNLPNLRRLRLHWCEDLTELPESLVKLRSLQELDLSLCRNLKQLPAGFGELATLTKLDLSQCRSLQELPCDLEKLTSLQSLDITFCSSLVCLPAGLGNSKSLTYLNTHGCSSLVCLPHSLEGLMSVWGSHINFDSWSRLSELPEEICKHTMLTSISLQHCSSLKTLPSRFGELTCLKYLDLRDCGSLSSLPLGFGELSSLYSLDLSNCKSFSSLPLGFQTLSSLETLDLSGCDKLEELCSDFHCLVALKYLNMSRCDSLCNLPNRFGELGCLETLDLSGCDKLEELCSDFHCLVALKYLNMSRCDSLCNLPNRFGELGCLERLNLSRCSKLVKLSDDFHFLRSLTRLDLSNCESLGGEWMDSVENISSLWRLDIVGSERMIQRWMETKSQKERNLVVVTDFPEGREGERALLLEGVLSKVFDEEGLLLDAHQHPFHSTSLQPRTPLILIIEPHFNYRELHESEEWGILGRHLQQLERNSKEMQIIYVGRYFNAFNALTSELATRILAHTPQSSHSSSFCSKLSDLFDSVFERIAVFRSTAGLEENGIKCFSAWEDISNYILDSLTFLTKTPRESNIELLTELLANGETDYLLLNENRQVKVADLQGKLILLLFTYLSDDLSEEYRVSISAVKEMYLKMQESHVVEVVWVPLAFRKNTWEEFERVAANAPWPVVPNPWLIRDRICSFVKAGRPGICVVDEKGRISNEDALPMIERWGVEAYPFSQGREEELRKAEWEGFEINSVSTLQFVFQTLESVSNKAKETMDRGAMTLVCVGSAGKMMELAADLNCALTLLEMDFQVFYVAHTYQNEDDMAWQKLKENESQIERKDMCSIVTPSFSDIVKFWWRVEHLLEELNGMGTDERIVKARRMVLGLANAHWESRNFEKRESEIRIVVVDENGEMVSGRGMEVVELLCHGEEDSKEKLVEDIKKGGVEKSVESRWRDGIIHPEHPRHPLLLRFTDNPFGCCSLCGETSCLLYQCNVCQKYGICRECR